MTDGIRTPERMEAIRRLVRLKQAELESFEKHQLIDMVSELSHELLAHLDVTCGPNTAAGFFNRKRSWIYEAMSRPGTELQRQLQRVAAREPGGLLFRLSDLVRIRRRLFRRDRRTDDV